MYDNIVFEKHYFRSSTSKREAGVFKYLNSADHFVKPAFFGARKKGKNLRLNSETPEYM